jgi:hypothetical protein
MVANEIQFLSWAEFRRMAPSVLRLEISRLSRVLQAGTLNAGFHNVLVKVRFDLTRFVACLECADKASVETACAEHLRSALLALSIERDELDEETAKTATYVMDRVKYVHDRIGLTY